MKLQHTLRAQCTHLARRTGWLLVLVLLVAGCGADAKDEAPARVDGFLSSSGAAGVAVLTGSSGWGVGGAAAFVDPFRDGTTMVMLQAESDSEGVPVNGYLVAGTCGARDASSAKLPLNATRDGHSDTRVEVGLKELLKDPHVMVVTSAADRAKEYSCGEIARDRSTWTAFGKIAARIRQRSK